MEIKCPKCGRRVPWEDNEWRPFCSKRCKMADLGAWVTEGYRIPGEPDDESLTGEDNPEDESN